MPRFYFIFYLTLSKPSLILSSCRNENCFMIIRICPSVIFVESYYPSSQICFLQLHVQHYLLDCIFCEIPKQNWLHSCLLILINTNQHVLFFFPSLSSDTKTKKHITTCSEKPFSTIAIFINYKNFPFTVISVSYLKKGKKKRRFKKRVTVFY